MELICDTVKFAVVQIISDRQQANRFARGTNTYNNPCVCAAVDRIGARPLNQIIAREHLTHNTDREQKHNQSAGGGGGGRVYRYLSFSSMVPGARNRALAANTACSWYYLFIYLLILLSARGVYIKLGPYLVWANNCASHREINKKSARSVLCHAAAAGVPLMLNQQ